MTDEGKLDKKNPLAMENFYSKGALVLSVFNNLLYPWKLRASEAWKSHRHSRVRPFLAQPAFPFAGREDKEGKQLISRVENLCCACLLASLLYEGGNKKNVLVATFFFTKRRAAEKTEEESARVFIKYSTSTKTSQERETIWIKFVCCKGKIPGKT